MNPRRDGAILYWNLKEVVKYLIQRFPSILEIYLFGSRAYKTGSLRSDIDLLVYSADPLELRRDSE